MMGRYTVQLITSHGPALGAADVIAAADGALTVIKMMTPNAKLKKAMNPRFNMLLLSIAD